MATPLETELLNNRRNRVLEIATAIAPTILAEYARYYLPKDGTARLHMAASAIYDVAVDMEQREQEIYTKSS